MAIGVKCKVTDSDQLGFKRQNANISWSLVSLHRHG